MNRRGFLSGAIAAPIVALSPLYSRAAPIAHCGAFIGQSNNRAAGTVGVGFPGGWAADADNKTWYYYAQAFQPYVPGTNSDWTPSTAWGPEAEFTRRWRADNPTLPFYGWKQAVDGTPVYPGGNTWSPRNGPKSQWMNLLENTKAMKSALGALGLTPHFDVLSIVQGETDEMNNHGNDWAANMLELISLFRQLVEPDVKVVIARILPYWNQSGGLVREAQTWLGALPGNGWYSTDDVSTLSGSSGSHYDAPGIVTCGARGYDTYKAIS